MAKPMINQTGSSEKATVADVNRQKRKPTRNVPKQRFTPMLRFDSQAKCLRLNRVTQVNGEALSTPAVVISLAMLTETQRQVAIHVAKLVMSFANGVDIANPRSVKGKPETDKLPSLITEFHTHVSHLVSHPKAEVSSVTTDTTASDPDITVNSVAATQGMGNHSS